LKSTQPHTATFKTDEEILALIRVGDRAAFNALYDKYWKKIYRIAYSKVGSREVAEEIVEDFFIKLWLKRETLVINNFFPYLFTSIKNRCLNYIEEKTTQDRHWQYYSQFIPVSEETTSKSVAFNNLMEAIHGGMDQMPEKSKKVFELHKMEGKSIKEIAAQLNLSEKAIEYHLTNSLKKLRIYLKEFIV
jgi:RNA polymerase sigma-70 factor (ECF subfamily)